MPKKAKKKTFRGTQKQFMPNVKTVPATFVSIPSSSFEPASLSSTQNSNSAPSTPTASGRKLQKVDFISETESLSTVYTGNSTADQRTKGFRLIDLECLNEAMSRLHMCKDGKSTKIFMNFFIQK